MTKRVKLIVPGDETHPARGSSLVWPGFGLELTHISTDQPYEFSWVGDRNYLALHDLHLQDGETFVDGQRKQGRIDLRGRLTFAPPDTTISGWSELKEGRGSFIALTFDRNLGAEEIERSPGPDRLRPMLYFEDANLLATMSKLRAVMDGPHPADRLHVETLSLLACLEMSGVLNAQNGRDVVHAGQLSLRARDRVRTYIENHLSDDTSLAEMARQVGLSRFHFIRAFRATFGLSPYRYVMACRIERSKHLLSRTSDPIKEIASALGFSTQQQFASAFRNAVGVTPTEFRRSSR